MVSSSSSAQASNQDLWRAPFRGKKPVDVQVTIPGSKSVTNRALILAAQAEGTSKLRKPLVSRDCELMVAGLRALGIKINEVQVGEESLFEVTGGALKGPAKIDVGNAGTVMRFLPPLAALAEGPISFDGDPRSHERPLGPVIKALEELGITVDHGGRYSLPLTLENQSYKTGNGKIRGGEMNIDASASSQFLSALLLIAPSTELGITAKHVGGALPSMPHIEMTVQMLRDFGATVHVDRAANSWRVEPGKLKAQDLVIEPDLSNAAPFMSIAMVCGGSVTIMDWPKETTQPGDHLREILSRMGATIEFVGESQNQKSGLKITGGSEIKGIDIDLHEVGELTPAIATLCALANSPSYLQGIGHLRLHETDRLAALRTELNALGCEVVEEPTALRINPKPLHAGIFHTYDDHRLATAGATIGLAVDGIEVENIATTRKTITDFPGLWNSLLDQKN